MNLYVIRHGETNMGKNKIILIVAHGGVLRAINWYFKGIDNSLFICKNCKIYKYNF